MFKSKRHEQRIALLQSLALSISRLAVSSDITMLKFTGDHTVIQNNTFDGKTLKQAAKAANISNDDIRKRLEVIKKLAQTMAEVAVFYEP